MNLHKDRRPVIFHNDFWYFQEIIDTKLQNITEIKENDLLIISVPFFETFKYKDNIDGILKRCCDLDIPVMLDLIWLPLSTETGQLRYTDCVQVISQSMTKVLPLSGIKGGVCFWRQPVPKRFNMYPLGNNVGYSITKKYLEQFGYFHVRDSLKTLQNKWCKILNLSPHFSCSETASQQVKGLVLVMALTLIKGFIIFLVTPDSNSKQKLSNVREVFPRDIHFFNCNL